MAMVMATIATLILTTMVIMDTQIDTTIVTGTIIIGTGDKQEDGNANGSQLKPIGKVVHLKLSSEVHLLFWPHSSILQLLVISFALRNIDPLHNR